MRVPFVGRVSELRSLLAFLKRGGALTLVGPGGVGKSRLAHEAIARFVRDRAVECVFVPLAGVMPEAVTGTVMTALSIPEEPSRSPMQTLTSRLRDRTLILALDNCEHAPDETGALIDALRALPRVTVLATSQRRLDYTDEPVIEVEPFGRDDGIAFFMARAGLDARQAGSDTLETVTTIVDRLDGLAVALDLAAARLASLSLGQLAEELAVLRPYHLRSTRGTEPRHRTIGHVIAWSYSRLDERAKRIFALASLFSSEFNEDDLAAFGEYTREEAAAALDDLTRNSLAIAAEFGWRMLLPIHAVATRMLATTRNRKALDEAFALRMNELGASLTAQMRSGGQAAGAMPISAQQSRGRSSVRRSVSEQLTAC
jgi:predicted ATPase